PGLLHVVVGERLAAESLHPPGRLVERADLVREQRRADQLAGGLGLHASSSFSRAAISPRRSTFCRARSRGSSSRSQLEETNSRGAPVRSTTSRTSATIAPAGSTTELRPSRHPARIPHSHPDPSSEASVSTRSTPTAATGRCPRRSACGPGYPE